MAFVLLCLLFAAIWFAGGASRADAPGQMVVRGVSFTVLALALLLCDRRAASPARPVWAFVLALLALALLQLVPLPPSIWQSLPGRELLAEATDFVGQAPLWRPLSMAPGATMNAAASLIVPLAVLALITRLTKVERGWLPGLLLGLIAAQMLVAILQATGAPIPNPMLNDAEGQVDGMFANRNHFALYLAIGCLVAPVWAFLPNRKRELRVPLAIGLTGVFALTILISGSRAGVLLGALAFCAGVALVWPDIRRERRRYPRWILPALTAAGIALAGLLVVLSVSYDRAVSIERMFAADQGQDIRTRALPTVVTMIRTYFPAGTGLGTFDPVFRIHEPFELLRLDYLNHAHVDPLEFVLDTGVFGMALLVVALLWWASASLRAWTVASHPAPMLARLGSAVLLLIFVASLFDYPARTPAIMSMTVVAAFWLNGGGRPALPMHGQHL